MEASAFTLTRGVINTWLIGLEIRETDGWFFVCLFETLKPQRKKSFFLITCKNSEVPKN